MGDEYAYCPSCGLESHVGDFISNHGRCPYCEKPNPELGGNAYDRYSSRRTAASCANCGDPVDQDEFDDQWHHVDDGWQRDEDLDNDHPAEPVFTDDDLWRCPKCGSGNYDASCSNCGASRSMLDRIEDERKQRRDLEASRKRNTMNRRTADSEDRGGYNQMAKPGPGQTLNPFTNLPGAGAMTGQEETPAFNPGPKAPGMETEQGTAGDVTAFNPGPQAPGAGLFSGGSAADSGAGVPIKGGDARLVINGDPSTSFRDWNHPGAGSLDSQPTSQSKGSPSPASPEPSSVLTAPGMDGYSQGKTDAQPGQTSYGTGKLGPVTSMRIAAIDFLADQNTGNREELLFRAHRHASEKTCRLPVPTAQRVVQQFVAAVNREIAATPKPRRQAALRTAATLPDFPDELMF